MGCTNVNIFRGYFFRNSVNNKISVEKGREDMSKIICVFITIIFLVGCGSRKSEETTEKSQNPRMTVMQAEKSKKLIQEGVQHLSKNELAMALKSFNDAILLNPNDPEGYIILGQTFLKMKSYENAVNTFSAGTKIAPNSGPLYYLLAVSYGMNGRREEAVTAAQKSAGLFQQDNDIDNFKRSAILVEGIRRKAAEGTSN